MTSGVPKTLRAAKKEAFAQAYAAQPKDARNASAAYRASRDCSKMQTSTINSNAKKLLRETPVRLRIEEIERERECSPDVQVAKDTPADTGLKLEEERFCQHFVLNDNATAAYAEAFPYSKKWKAASRQNKASTLFNTDRVQARIRALRAKVAAVAEKSFDITVERVLKEYARMGYSNMEDYVVRQPDGTARLDLMKVGRDEMAAVQEMTFETVLSSAPEALAAAGIDPSEEDAPTKVPVIKTKFKLHDKKGPLDGLAKHLGLFAKDNAQAGDAAGKAMAEAADVSNRDLARSILDIFRAAKVDRGSNPQESA
jgi:phage terminase small subunit